jgi:twitching motility protein PilU
MVDKQASDLFITVGVPASIKVNGELEPVDDRNLSRADTLALVEASMNAEQRIEFLRHKELNYAISAPGIGRFRVSAFFQRESAGMVARRIQTTIPKVDELGLPPILKDIVMAKRGLFLFVGATGTGKSSSMASLMGYRNRYSHGHILSIEDPIEFVHQHQSSIVNQREVGVDTESFDAALQSALRQAPDVILIGEIRSRETMEFALSFAETGHLVLATLHANNANQALDRIMHLVPHEKINQMQFDLSFNLKALVAQQLIPTLDGKGRVAAIEVLINSPLVSELIRRGEFHKIKEAMSKSREQGMQTFDQALFDLYESRQINYSDALRHADSPNDLRLMIKLKLGDSGRFNQTLDGVSVDME